MKSNIQEQFIELIQNGGSKKEFEDLLTKGKVDFDTKDSRGKAPFYYAAKAKNIEAMEFLVSKNIAFDDRYQKDFPALLHLATTNNKAWDGMALVNFLLECGFDVNERDLSGSTPFHFAVVKNNQPLIEFFMQKGANLDIVDNHGNSVLHLAAQYGFRNLVTLFLDNDANIDLPNKNGDTPLHKSKQAGYEDVSEIFISRGAKTDVQNKHGKTAESPSYSPVLISPKSYPHTPSPNLYSSMNSDSSKFPPKFELTPARFVPTSVVKPRGLRTFDDSVLGGGVRK